MNDPYFARLLETLTAQGAGYRQQHTLTGAEWDLGVGEARYPLPAQLRRGIGRVCADTETLWYSSPLGEPELHDAYRNHLIGQPADIDPDRDAVLVTAGGKEAAWLAIRFLLHHSSAAAALVPLPGWEPYRFWLDAAGCPQIPYDPVAVAADPNLLRRLIIDSEPQPSLLIVNYPHNPTGIGVTQQAMNDIVQIAAEFGIALLSDEVYRLFGNADVSVAHAPARDPRRHVVVDSCSKALTVAGLRVGFLTAHRRVVDDLAAFRGSYASCTSVLNQRIAAHLLTDAAARAWLAEVRSAAADTRIATAKALTDHGIEVVSHGGLYIWSRTPDRTSLPPQTGRGGGGAARISSGAGFGAADHFRVCTARAGLDPASAAAAVVAAVRG